MSIEVNVEVPAVLKDYSLLINKPKINGCKIEGEISLAKLGLADGYFYDDPEQTVLDCDNGQTAATPVAALGNTLLQNAYEVGDACLQPDKLYTVIFNGTTYKNLPVFHDASLMADCLGAVPQRGAGYAAVSSAGNSECPFTFGTLRDDSMMVTLLGSTAYVLCGDTAFYSIKVIRQDESMIAGISNSTQPTSTDDNALIFDMNTDVLLQSGSHYILRICYSGNSVIEIPGTARTDEQGNIFIGNKYDDIADGVLGADSLQYMFRLTNTSDKKLRLVLYDEMPDTSDIANSAEIPNIAGTPYYAKIYHRNRSVRPFPAELTGQQELHIIVRYDEDEETLSCSVPYAEIVNAVKNGKALRATMINTVYGAYKYFEYIPCTNAVVKDSEITISFVSAENETDYTFTLTANNTASVSEVSGA